MVPGSTSRKAVPRTAATDSRRLARFGRSPWAAAVIVALCVLAQWPGVFSIPPIDRDESRFAQATRQIVEAAREGDAENVIVPRVQKEPRLIKPPLVYYVQAIPGAAFDRAEITGAPGTGAGLPIGRIWAYRLATLLCTMATALLTWRLGLAMRLHPYAAMLAGAFMATCVIQLVDGREARADQLLVTMTAAMQLCLWKVWARRRRARARSHDLAAAIGFWVFLSLGIMTKGPVTPMVAALTIAALCLWGRDVRWVGRLRIWRGLVIAGVIVLPWFVAVSWVVGFEKYWAVVTDELVGHGVTGRDSHWGPPGYHLVLLAVLLFPGTLFTAAGVIAAFRRVFGFERHHGQPGGERASSNLLPLRIARGIGRLWRRRGGRDAEAFLLAWIVPSWIVFELMTTKLPHYTLPLYPPVALISARALLAATAKGEALARERGLRAGMMVYLAIGVAIVVGVPGALVLWGGQRWVVAVIALGGALVVLAAAQMWTLGREGAVLRAQWTMIAAMIVASVCVFALLLPTNRHLWVSSRLVQVMRRIAAPDALLSRPIGATGYHEDSLVFLTRGKVEWVKRDDAAAWLDEHPRGLLIAPADVQAPGATAAAAVRGFDYTDGKWVSLEILTKKPESGDQK